MQEFSILAEYEDCWPASDFMIVHLKNTKQREKKSKRKGKERANMKDDDSEGEEDEEE